jgi:hypothetical protein
VEKLWKDNFSTNICVTQVVTEEAGSISNICDLYLGSTKFESWLEHKLTS